MRKRSRGILPESPLDQEQVAEQTTSKGLAAEDRVMSNLQTNEDLYQTAKIAGEEQATPTEGGNAATGFASSLGSGIAQRGAAGGNESDIVAGSMMATGNPYAIGAGAGLMVLGAKSKRKDQYKRDLYEAQLKRIERQQEALQSLMSMSQRMQL